MTFELQGEKLSGIWNLVRTHIPGKQEQWFLIKHQDSSAKAEAEYSIVDDQPNSVLSDRTLIPRKRGKAALKQTSAPVPEQKHVQQTLGRKADLPEKLAPELATLVDSTPRGDDWRYEIKFDGYRMLGRIEDGNVKLFTRNGHDWTAKLPHLEKALAGLKMDTAWVDGEIVIPDERGLPSFQLLQNAFDSGKSAAIVYYLFDLPYFNGFDLRDVPVEQRRGALKRLLKDNDDKSFDTPMTLKNRLMHC